MKPYAILSLSKGDGKSAFGRRPLSLTRARKRAPDKGREDLNSANLIHHLSGINSLRKQFFLPERQTVGCPTLTYNQPHE